jgi:replicative DNA helicase
MLALEDPFAQAIAEAQVAARFHLTKQKILELAVHANRGQRRPPVPMVDLEAEFLEQAYNSDAAIDQSVDTGIASLDAYLQGIFPGDLFVIAGRPSMGKSALGLQICKSIAQRYRRPVLIFSFEVSRLKIMNRLVAAETSIDSNRIQRVLYPHDSPEEARIDAARKMLGSLPMHFDAMQKTTIDDIESISKDLSCQGKLGAILIDHLGLIHGPTTEQRTQQVGDYTRRLKLLAGEMDCPVIVLSQLSRGVESRTNKRPMNSDLRESGSVEQDADQILMVYRDEYYNPASPDRGIAELIVTKNRDGATGTARTLFEPEYTRFRSLVV